MKRIALFNSFTLLLVCLSTLFVSAQSGDTYQITQSVIANGGGKSADATYVIEGTIGQHAVGAISDALPYRTFGGFWTPDQLAPTAADVSISGRVATSSGYGIPNTIVLAVFGNGTSRSSRTNSFGNYEIGEIAAGQTVMVTVNSRRFRFASRVITVMDNLTGVDFVAIDSESVRR